MIKLPANKSYRIVAYGDIHAPFQNDTAINLLCKLIRAFNPNVAVNIGDGVDFLALSSFLKTPRQEAGLQREIDTYKQVQAKINKATGDAQRFFMVGNHERRLERSIKSKAPALLGLDSLNIEQVLGLDDLGMRAEPKNLFIGNVAFTHGHLVRKHSGASPMAHLEGVGYTHSIIHGHSHRQAVVSKAVFGGQVFGAEIGHLADESKMDYLNGMANWQTGCALIEYRDGKLAIELVPFVGDRKLTALWRGKLFRA